MSTKATVDLDDARRTLYSAYDIAQRGVTPKCPHTAFIDFVLDNTHLTYKYVLVNALLAKATNSAINPLCLQKKSTLPGAYDARTICHKVLVQFEKEELGKALGGSNEPFLNKPARFTDLDKSNAVRAGNDREILESLCDNLPKITSSKEAFDCLVYALIKLLAVKKEKAELTNFALSSVETDKSVATLYGFIDALLQQNFEGEILTLVVAGLFEQFMQGYDDYLVDVHPVNESGASSKEVSDLDVFLAGNLFVSNELKDKEFTDHDLSHAADKVIDAGLMQMNFIVGRHGGCERNVIKKVVPVYQEKGFMLNIVSVDSFVRTMLTLIDSVDVEGFLKYILATARDTKFKETTINYIRATADRFFDFAK